MQIFFVEPALLEQSSICNQKWQMVETSEIHLFSCLCLIHSAIMLKRIYRSTPPEVIVEVLEPYVRLTTANVRIIKNRTGPMGHTYGFIDLDSHAVSFHYLSFRSEGRVT